MIPKNILKNIEAFWHNFSITNTKIPEYPEI